MITTTITATETITRISNKLLLKERNGNRQSHHCYFWLLYLPPCLICGHSSIGLLAWTFALNWTGTENQWGKKLHWIDHGNVGVLEWGAGTEGDMWVGQEGDTGKGGGQNTLDQQVSLVFKNRVVFKRGSEGRERDIKGGEPPLWIHPPARLPPPN